MGDLGSIIWASRAWVVFPMLRQCSGTSMYNLPRKGGQVRSQRALGGISESCVNPRAQLPVRRRRSRSSWKSPTPERFRSPLRVAPGGSELCPEALRESQGAEPPRLALLSHSLSSAASRGRRAKHIAVEFLAREEPTGGGTSWELRSYSAVGRCSARCSHTEPPVVRRLGSSLAIRRIRGPTTESHLYCRR